MIIPMPDDHPKYPKIDPEEMINPNHPNFTIWGSRIEVALFIGIHCHYADLASRNGAGRDQLPHHRVLP